MRSTRWKTWWKKYVTSKHVNRSMSSSTRWNSKSPVPRLFDLVRWSPVISISVGHCFACSILVTNYAKKTGDYAFLSAVDLRLLALTYQLYEENVGTDKLNLEPKINVSVSPWRKRFEYTFLSCFHTQAAIASSATTYGNAGIKLAGFVFPKNEVRIKSLPKVGFDELCFLFRRTMVNSS